MKTTCSGCKWWQPCKSDDTLGGSDNHDGECRRNAPRLILAMAPDKLKAWTSNAAGEQHEDWEDDALSRVFPLTRSSDWCGDAVAEPLSVVVAVGGEIKMRRFLSSEYGATHTPEQEAAEQLIDSIMLDNRKLVYDLSRKLCGRANSGVGVMVSAFLMQWFGYRRLRYSQNMPPSYPLPPILEEQTARLPAMVDILTHLLKTKARSESSCGVFKRIIDELHSNPNQ